MISGTNRVPFTLTYHSQNLAIKNVILKNLKILCNDPKTKHIFSFPPLISFKCHKNLVNFLVRSAFKSDNQPGTFTCKCTWWKTCPFISNTVKISGPNRFVKVTDRFTCISLNGMGCFMVNVWFSCWFGMGYCHPYKSHADHCVWFCCLFYWNASYFVKFHISPIGYDMVIVWFGSIAVSCNFSALSMGMLRIYVPHKSHSMIWECSI